jgi:hypothetical protein
MKLESISLGCKYTDINWECIPELPSRLEKHSFRVERFSADLNKYPIFATFSDIPSTIEYIKAKGRPRRYDVYFSDKDNEKTLSIQKFINLHDEKVLLLKAKGCGDEPMLCDIAAFLGLQPDIEDDDKALKRSAFIAHRFDEKGMDLAEKLARFLSLLGFSVKTGRAFAPKSVSDKVKERLQSQSIIFAILTPGDPKTWLIQESVLQHENKPLFILKQSDASFDPGMLADHEYIPFIDGHFESTYQPILEGFSELEREVSPVI